MAHKTRITVLSAACCNPAFEAHDREYLARIREVLRKTGLEAQVDVLPATDAVFGAKLGYVRQLMPLFRKYGLAVAPALFVDQDLVLYGGVPTMEKLEEVLANAAKAGGP